MISDDVYNQVYSIMIILFQLFVFFFVLADSPCFPNPCKNRGECTVNGTAYSCSCLNGFSGNNCEIQGMVFIL